MLKCGTKTGVICLSFGHFVADFYNNFLPVLLPFIMVKLDMSLTMCGMLIMVMSFTANTIQPGIGYMIDKHDCGRWLPVVIPLCGLFMCFTGYAPNQPVLFLLCALLGLTVAVIHPLGTALLGKVGNPENMGRYMACYILFGNIGFAIVPIIVMAFLSAYPIEYLPVLAIPAVILGFVYIVTGIYKLPSAGAKKRTAEDEQPINFVELFKNKAVIMLNLAMAFRCWTHVAVSTFLPMLLLSHGYSSMMSGSMLSIFLIGSAVGGICGGELGDRFGHKRLMTISLFLTVIPVFFFFQYPTAGIWSSIALFFGGAFVQAPQPSSIVWTGRLMPKNIGMASGMMMGLCFGLGSVGAALTAALGDHIGLESALIISILPVAIAGLVTMLTPYPQGYRS